MEFRFNPKKTFDIFHDLRPILGSETIVQEEAGAEEGGGGGWLLLYRLCDKMR